MKVFDDEKTREALRAAGIHCSAEQLATASERFNDIAEAFLRERFHTAADERGRWRTVMGTKLRAQLFGDLYGAWIELPGVAALPGYAYKAETGMYLGPFVEFVKSFCGIIASHVEAIPGATDHSTWRGAVHNLRVIERGKGVAIRDAFRLLGFEGNPLLGKVRIPELPKGDPLLAVARRWAKTKVPH